MATKKSLIYNSFFSFIRTLSGMLFPLITFTYSARILGVEGVGRVNFSKSIISYFTLLAGLGMNYYGTREAAKLRDNRNQLSCFVHEMLLINGLTTILAYVLLIIATIAVSKLHGYETLLSICSFAIVMQGLGMEWLYQAMEEYHYIAIRSMVFQGIALILMFFLVRDTSDAAMYAIVTVFASSGSYVMNFIHARRYIDFRTRRRCKIVKHMKPLLWLFAMALSIELYTVLDSSMLGFLKGDIAVGKYSAAVKINKLSNQLIMAIGVVLIPRISYYIGQGEREKVGKLVTHTYNYVFMLSVPAMVGLYILSDDLVLLLSGREFASAGLTMRLLTPIVLVIPFSAITNQQTFVPMGKEKLILLSTCVGAITNFTCNMILIPRFAENGAAISTVLAESAVAVVCFCNAQRYFDMQEIFRQYIQYWLASLPIPVIAFIFRRLPLPQIIQIGCIMLFSVISYFAFLWIFGNMYFIQTVGLVKRKILHNK